MRIFCPKHKTTEIYPLYLNYNKSKKLRVKAKTDIFYCVSCRLPYRVEIKIAFEKYEELQ